MKKTFGFSAVFLVIGIVVLLLIIACGFMLFHSRNNVSSQTTTSNQAQQATDLAPNMPADQKATVVIRNTDSSTTTYLIPKDQVEDYIKHLPPGEEVVLK